MDDYIVWGKVHGNELLIKIFGGTIEQCIDWKNRNQKYYDDMRIYKNKAV